MECPVQVKCCVVMPNRRELHTSGNVRVQSGGGGGIVQNSSGALRVNVRRGT